MTHAYPHVFLIRLVFVSLFVVGDDDTRGHAIEDVMRPEDCPRRLFFRDMCGIMPVPCLAMLVHAPARTCMTGMYVVIPARMAGHTFSALRTPPV